ncbi:MAG: molecular chaperone TorD family protein [Chloroflexi bacterium]|nr:molecular chaperone TorD family protein [Chloroflexota bacterium]
MTDRADNGSRAPSPSFGELARLFVNRRDVKFWQSEGAEHGYLYWVRAMISEDAEPVPYVSRPVTQPQSEAERLRFAEARTRAYGFLGRAFEYPDDPFLAEIGDPATARSLAGAFRQLADNDDVRAGVEIWEAMTAREEGLVGEYGLSPLREEYTRMVYDSNLPCIPPYESVYANERQVMGKHALAVEAFYRRAGLGVADNEMPDHIALECEFVAHLAGLEAAAWQAGQRDEAERLWQTERQFLTSHLLSWGGKFCADLQRLAREDFYRAIARLGAGLFNDELVRLKSDA